MGFLSLLVVVFLLSTVLSILVAWAFLPAVRRILHRIIGDEVYTAWVRYIMFALVVLGISGGTRLWQLQRYLPAGAGPEGPPPLELTRDRWILELVQTVLSCLSSVAWGLLVFFLVALAAFAVVRLAETRTERKA